MHVKYRKSLYKNLKYLNIEEKSNYILNFSKNLYLIKND
jgi:hypothetical protein